MPPLVSILTPSFNREHLVVETLESVLEQRYPHWEMLVVDDGSTDRTREVVAGYAARDSRIRLYNRTWEPKGACACRNEGVSMCGGDYVMFLDTDDIIEPFCLENRVAAMDGQPDLDFGLFPGLMFERTPRDLGLWWNVDKPTDELSRQFRQDAIAQGTGVLWRKTSFVGIGMWDKDLLIWQDIDLFFRAYIQGYRYAKFFELPPDLHNRTNHGSLSRAGFFGSGKLASRVAVVKRAATLLVENDMKERIPELRFMTAEIISGAARSAQASTAFSFLRWAAASHVLSMGQGLRLAVLAGLYLSRLTRVPPVLRLARAFEQPFRSQSTLGKVPYHVGEAPRIGFA